jgi:hypothetical protein
MNQLLEIQVFLMVNSWKRDLIKMWREITKFSILPILLLAEISKLMDIPSILWIVMNILENGFKKTSNEKIQQKKINNIKA